MIEGYYLNQSIYLGPSKGVAAHELDKRSLRHTDVVDYLFVEPPVPPQWASKSRKWFPELAVFFKRAYGPK